VNIPFSFLPERNPPFIGITLYGNGGRFVEIEFNFAKAALLLQGISISHILEKITCDFKTTTYDTRTNI
jgi:hypothetical protein